MTLEMRPTLTGRPRWADWRAAPAPYTVGIEEEAMLLDPVGWTLSPTCTEVLETLPPDLAQRCTAETHGSAVEIATGVHSTVGAAAEELIALRRALAEALDLRGLAVASAGTHPFAVWSDIVVSPGERYQFLYGSLRELARREPTHALHVHVGISNPDDAIRACNRLRAHLPLLLALSGSSPFWQGRDTGLASARTPLFQAFPRVGIPRAFGSYGEYVRAINLLLDCDAFPDSTYLWWDVRPQPKLGTVEIRIMDAQSTLDATAALVALVQSLVRLEVVEGHADAALVHAPEVLDENRFLAARDGVEAALVDPVRGHAVPVYDVASGLVLACAPHARELGCADELQRVAALFDEPGAEHQRRLAERGGLNGLVERLAADFGRRRSIRDRP